jgi:phosphatidylglycerophosphatase A
MAIKESSDELNPAVMIPASEVPARKRRTAGDYLALALATCGVGYFPIAPGTLGSLLGTAIFLGCSSGLSRSFPEPYLTEPNLRDPFTIVDGIHISAYFRSAAVPILVALISLVGVWAASRAEKVINKKDPSIVVIDEVAGQMIALLSVPFWLQTWWTVLSAFILFRAFDIWKPYPIRRLEALESGLGIMADDVLAGIYALIVNLVLIATYLFIVAPRG